MAKEEGDSKPVPFEVRAGIGVGMSEAPRGVVFHKLEFDDEGRVLHASIITPTSQNLASLEADTRLLSKCSLKQGSTKATSAPRSPNSSAPTTRAFPVAFIKLHSSTVSFCVRGAYDRIESCTIKTVRNTHVLF